MSAERFFDDLARTLAEPMPRQRAVRVIGVSLAAIAVPGVSPRSALAGPTHGSGAALVCAGKQICKRYKDPNDWTKGQEEKCCPFPAQQWRCGPDGWTCLDTCAAVGRAFGKKTKPTWSTERLGGTDPDLRDRPKRYDCCVLPDTIPSNGECLPNCKTMLGPQAIQCGKQCCAPGQECVTWLSSNTGLPPKKACARACKPGERRCPATPGHFPVCCARACCGGTCCADGEECTRWVVQSGATFTLCRPKCKAPEKRCDTDCCRDEQRFYRKNAKGELMCRCRQ